MKKTKLNGVHLWAVKTNLGSYDHLWITTRRKSVEDAIKKAVSFERTQSRRGKADITRAEYHGTIDA